MFYTKLTSLRSCLLLQITFSFQSVLRLRNVVQIDLSVMVDNSFQLSIPHRYTPRITNFNIKEYYKMEAVFIVLNLRNRNKALSTCPRMD